MEDGARFAEIISNSCNTILLLLLPSIMFRSFCNTNWFYSLSLQGLDKMPGGRPRRRGVASRYQRDPTPSAEEQPTADEEQPTRTSSGRRQSTRRLQFVAEPTAQQGVTTTTTRSSSSSSDSEHGGQETPGESASTERPKIYQRGPSSLPSAPIVPSRRPVIRPCGDK
jgi:hypothetical protein